MWNQIMTKTDNQKSLVAFRENDEGVASIEFAIIAPFMLIMYFGLAQVASAIAVDRRISHGANVAGDMVTQAPEATAEDIEEILSATIRVMNVPTVAVSSGDETNRVSTAFRISMDIESFILDSSGNPESHGRILLNPTTALADSYDASTLDERLLSENSGVVVTRVSYIYSPIVKPDATSEFKRNKDKGEYKVKKFQGDITLTETFLLKPRRSDVVELGPDARVDPDVPVTITCTASSYQNVSCPLVAAVAGG